MKLHSPLYKYICRRHGPYVSHTDGKATSKVMVQDVLETGVSKARKMSNMKPHQCAIIVLCLRRFFIDVHYDCCRRV